ncbi:MAG TPA: hypothetical protein DIW27_06095 [Cytophagales bacterium]|nr:hypothetical protein [Cytophagales bacterium]HRJ55192.1 FkbM family methyltransferase [Anaerolineales bacterium]
MAVSEEQDTNNNLGSMSGLSQLESAHSVDDIFKYVDRNSLEQLKCNLLNYQRKLNGLPEVFSISSSEQFQSAYDEIKNFIRGGLEINWEEYIRDAKENIDEYIWLFNNLLKDQKSKDVFFNLFYSRLTLSKEHLRAAFSNETQYFDEKNVSFLNGEILVDCGAFIGDSIIEYALKNPFYKRIYAYEAFPESFKKCNENLTPLYNDGRISVRQVIVSNKHGWLNFQENALPGSNAIDENGRLKIESVSLDEDILERVSFIKMDIEGAEMLALEGARKHIIEEAPTLAICVYHFPDHLWKIAKLIYSMNPAYSFTLRHHSTFARFETVLYATSPDRGSFIVEDPFIKSYLAQTSLAVRIRDNNTFNMIKVRDTYIDQLEGAIRWFQKQLNENQKVIETLQSQLKNKHESKDNKRILGVVSSLIKKFKR